MNLTLQLYTTDDVCRQLGCTYDDLYKIRGRAGVDTYVRVHGRRCFTGRDLAEIRKNLELLRMPRTGQVAAQLGVQAHHLQNAIRDGKINRPVNRLGCWVCWTPAEIEAARAYFASKNIA